MLINYFEMKCGQYSLLVEILSILLGINSLIATNGLWVELPVMIPYLPEGWELPAYLTIIIQVANIGPIVYSLAAFRWPKVVTETRAIYIMLAIGLLATIFIIPFWSSTVWLLGQYRCVPLLVLTFFLALVDTVSSVVCLPYMALLKSHYVTFYMIGESLGGFLPSIVALAQGVEEYTQCQNVSIWNSTMNTTVYQLEEISGSPLFSSEIFFGFLVFMMIISSIGFILLNSYPAALKEHITNKMSQEIKELQQRKDPNGLLLLNDNIETNHKYDKKDSYRNTKNSFTTDFPENLNNQNGTSDCNEVMLSSFKNSETNVEVYQPRRRHYYQLLFLQGWVSALGYGMFPAIQSYSCLPYGSEAFHLAVILISTATPVSCIIALIFPTKKVNIVTLLTVCGTLISLYIMTTAAMSPYPPLVGTSIGNVILLISWCLFTGLFGYVKVAIAAILRLHGHRALFWCGALTQAGSALGALVMFLLVSVFHIFKEKEVC